jgi:hypothetical protein
MGMERFLAFGTVVGYLTLGLIEHAVVAYAAFKKGK